MDIKGVWHFIVKIDNPYNEEYEAKGHDGSNLVRSHLFNDHDNATKSGIVVSSPTDKVPVGAKLYFDYIIVEWRKKNAGGELFVIDKEEGLYRVPWRPIDYPDPLHNKAYAFEVDGKIETINDWIFLEQEKAKLKETESGLVIVEKVEDVIYSSGEAAPKQQYSRVRYLNDHFREMGLKEGDLVVTRKDVECAMEVNGKVYWRVWDRHVLAKVDEQ